MNYESDVNVNFDLRKPDFQVDALFYKRWSPRSFQKQKIEEADLNTLFEAARWSPSCFNEQPWRFITSSEKSFAKFLSLLNDTNQSWAINASLIGFIIATTRFEKNAKHNAYAEFDCGAAWMGMTLQARKLGLYTHGMAGIKHEEVARAFNLDPEKEKVICGFALGVLDSKEKLTQELAIKEQPKGRKALSEVWQVID